MLNCMIFYSKPKFLNTVIPQYSVLAPLLFIIYIQHLSMVIQRFSKIKYHIYAYYITIYTSYDPSSMYAEQYHMCVDSLNNWLLANQLLLNKSKTELLNISNHLENYANIVIDGESIKSSQSITYLGLQKKLIMLCIK